MQWKPDITSGIVATTPFARLTVYPTPSARRRSVFYTGRVEGSGRKVLAGRADFLTGEDAQRWAERAYADLLRAELALVEPVEG